MAAAGKGSAGALKISEVDSDRLWRDRVSQELMYQRQWVEEYGFMLDEEKRERLKAGNASTFNAESTTQSKSPDDTLGSASGGSSVSSPKKSTLSFTSTPSVGGMASTMRSSFKTLPSPEIKNDPSPHRRRKHPP